jgi:uncharacterized protein YqjF (DUF2071 family)
MSVEWHQDVVSYRSRRTHRHAPPAEFVARYGPSGPVYQARSGSLDYFLVERYCLFNQDRDGAIGVIDVQHVPWPIQTATVTIERNTMAGAVGIAIPDEPPVAHFARALDVVAWNRALLSE